MKDFYRALLVLAILIFALIALFFDFKNRATGETEKKDIAPIELQKEADMPNVEDITASARIRAVEGTPLIQRGTDIFYAENNFPLNAGDIIQTGPTSTVDILWPFYGHTVVGNESIFILSKSDISNYRLFVHARLEAGRVWTRLQKLLETGDDFGIEASDVASVVRGTSFGVLQLPNSVSIRVHEDTVRVFRTLSNGTFQASGSDVLVSAGEEETVPIGSGSDTRPLPQPRSLDTEYLQDPIFILGDSSVPTTELEDIIMPNTTKPKRLMTTNAIVYRSRVIPLSDLYVFTDREAECSAPHYHALNKTVTALDGTMIPDPGGCGFGRVQETSTSTFSIY
ncbi:MAG: hypothetical protein NUV81_00150 [bacterium]|nr:hypothetical protein [bacterium]